MLIVEGPDLVGKTTLAKKIALKLNECGWPHIYQHLSRLPECSRHDILGMYRRLMNPYTVRDRFHYSEPLYAAIRGDAALLGPGSYKQIERELLNYEKFLIVITADDELIEARHKKLGRKEMYDLDKILQVNQLYYTAAEEQHYGAYEMPHDLWIHCTADQPFVELGEHLNLNIYLNRLWSTFSYAGATRRIEFAA
jgi:hypothetical protein